MTLRELQIERAALCQCWDSCSYPIAAGARVTITRDPDTCVGARTWDGCAPSGNQCTVTMNGQITVTEMRKPK